MNSDQISNFAQSDEDSQLSKIFKQAQDVLGAIRHETASQFENRTGPTFPISKVAELVGRTDSLIREAERKGRLPEPRRGEKARRLNYTLAEINHMREVFGTVKKRGPGDPPAIVAVQNFKGGVGKSTLSVNLAQYLAIQGYRVCLMDFDSQGTATAMFGYSPDLDLDGEEDTLYGYLSNGLESVPPRIIKGTHFENLKLVPANLDLYQAEYELAAHIARMGNDGHIAFNRISTAVREISQDFDIIIMDPPPALGMISLGVLSSANAMVIPVPPTIVDFASTASFLGMARESMSILSQYRAKPIFNFVRLVGSKTSENKGMHKVMLGIMQDVFGRTLLSATLKDSAEIDNASARFRTVYELDRPISKRDVHERCIASLNAVCGEIELEIRKSWPSHSDALSKEGLI